MAKQNKKYKLISAGIAMVAILIFIGMKITKKPISVPNIISNKKENTVDKVPEKSLLVQTDDGSVKKININTGKTEEASNLEKEDFTDFVGLPKLGDDKKQDIEQTKVISSNDKTEAIVSITVYDSQAVSQNNESQPILSTADYLCDVAKKTCQKSELLLQAYQGLDATLQKNSNTFVWEAFDSAKQLLFAHLASEDAGDVSPVYVCDIKTKSCVKTEGYDSKKKGEVKAVLPSGSLSPSLDRFVMINQHDQPNIETGKNWELLIFDSNNLASPLRAYDLSAIIDQDENVAYDAVHSVAWSGDESKLAIGTSRRIFMLDLKTGGLSFAFIAQTNSDGDFYWDSSELFLSPDAKFIAFVDEGDIIDKSPDNSEQSDENSVDQSDVTYINVLKKIDLENSNQISELMRGAGLGLK